MFIEKIFRCPYPHHCTQRELVKKSEEEKEEYNSNTNRFSLRGALESKSLRFNAGGKKHALEKKLEAKDVE